MSNLIFELKYVTDDNRIVNTRIQTEGGILTHEIPNEVFDELERIVSTADFKRFMARILGLEELFTRDALSETRHYHRQETLILPEGTNGAISKVRISNPPLEAALEGDFAEIPETEDTDPAVNIQLTTIEVAKNGDLQMPTHFSAGVVGNYRWIKGTDVIRFQSGSEVSPDDIVQVLKTVDSPTGVPGLGPGSVSDIPKLFVVGTDQDFIGPSEDGVGRAGLLDVTIGTDATGILTGGTNATVFAGEPLTATIGLKNEGSAPLVWSDVATSIEALVTSITPDPTEGAITIAPEETLLIELDLDTSTLGTFEVDVTFETNDSFTPSVIVSMVWEVSGPIGPSPLIESDLMPGTGLAYSRVLLGPGAGASEFIIAAPASAILPDPLLVPDYGVLIGFFPVINVYIDGASFPPDTVVVGFMNDTGAPVSFLVSDTLTIDGLTVGVVPTTQLGTIVVPANVLPGVLPPSVVYAYVTTDGRLFHHSTAVVGGFTVGPFPFGVGPQL